MRQAPEFLICGEALIDAFVSDGAIDSGGIREFPGGSPFNVAVGLVRLGRGAALATGISTDVRGRRLREALEAEGVMTDFLSATDEPTTMSRVSVDASGIPHYEFTGISERQVGRQLFDRLPEAVRYVHVGSYAMVVEPSASVFGDLLEREGGTRLLSWDPNVRLNVEPSRDRWRRLEQWMTGRVDLVKASEDDVSVLAPGVTPADWAAKAIGNGVHLVVVTLGARGAVGFTAECAVQVAAAPVAVVDTLGAGDAFQAALLCALAERGITTRSQLSALTSDSLVGVLRFAAAAASLACGRRGADPPRREVLPA